MVVISRSYWELGIIVARCLFVGGSSELVSFSFLFFGYFLLPSGHSHIFSHTVFCSIFGAVGVYHHLPVRRHVLQAFYKGIVSVFVACRFNPRP
ncbi:hypothetical protein AMTRI_Chr05g72450 [Amborella trichopoda]